MGGAKYQISSVALPICVVTLDILVKYQYKGMFFVSIFVAVILIIFGLLRFSSVLKYMSSSYLSALVCCVSLFIIVSQIPNILGINTVQYSQSFFQNIDILFANLNKVPRTGIAWAIGFMLPLMLIRLQIKSNFSYFIYLCLGVGVVFAEQRGLLPFIPNLSTVGSELSTTQIFQNITTISRSVPSQTFLLNMVSYSFVIALVIATEVCLCTNISASITGNKKLQTNAELVSSGITNFLSIACGGLFVSPDIALTLKNIEYKAKTVLGFLLVGCLSIAFILCSKVILDYIPTLCISSILVIFASSVVYNRNPLQYLNFKSTENYIFMLTAFVMLYFGFVPAVIIGFTVTNIFFTKRMIRINDATVHTTKNHDSAAIDFMMKKNGYKMSGISKKVIDKIEVIQVNNALFLNIAKVVEESLEARGNFPRVLIIYFQNIPFLDGEAFRSLKCIVSKAKENSGIVIISGTNGMLLNILQQRAKEENSKESFGYIVPNFAEAIKKAVERLK